MSDHPYGPGVSVVADAANGKDAWLEARRNLVTASDAAVLTGHHPYQTRAELLVKKLTGDRFEPNAAMWFGTQREDGNVRIFGLLSGLHMNAGVNGKLLVNDRYPYLGATLDSYVVGPAWDRTIEAANVPEELRIEAGLEPGAPVEVKNVRSRSRSLWKKPVATPKSRLFHYWAQVQLQLLVTGHPVGGLFAVVDSCEPYCHRIEANEKYQARLVEEAQRFVEELGSLRF